jgi:hypothetical protein
MRKFSCLCLAIAVLPIGGAGIVQQAQARWKSQYANAPYAEWYKRQRDHVGWSCCDLSDAHPVYDAYIKRGKWHVPIHGRDYEINPRQLLDGPNPTGHVAKGEDPSVVAGHVKAWINKNNDVGGEGSRPPEDQRDPAEQLEELVDAYVATHKVKRSQAYDRVLHARPDINAALARQRDAKLHKAAQAIGDSYGMR